MKSDSRLTLLESDITGLEVDAIVNAANETLLGGGGVDGAIHLAAGPGLLEECRRLGGCPTGDAKITAGYNLAARHVIHTVGPIWRGGTDGEAGLLANCYRNTLALAAAHDCARIAFPAISTGVYGYPPGPAARIAVSTAWDVLAHDQTINEVIFVCFNRAAMSAYQDAMATIAPDGL